MSRKYRDGDSTPSSVKDSLVACCDCGLVHQHVHSVREDGVLMVQVLRDNRATAQVRRHMAETGRLVREAASNVYILPLRIRRSRAIKRLDVKIEPGDPNETIDSITTLHHSDAPRAARGKGNDRKRARGSR